MFTENHPNSQFYQSGNILNEGGAISASGAELTLVASEIFCLEPVSPGGASTVGAGVRYLRESPGTNLFDVTDSADLAHLRIASPQGGLIDSQGILQTGILSPRPDEIPPFDGWNTQTRWRDRSWDILQGHSDPPRALARVPIPYTAAELGGVEANGFPDLSGSRSSQPDADLDGMSDIWESDQGAGDDGDLDPKEGAELSGHTQIEVYINGLVE